MRYGWLGFALSVCVAAQDKDKRLVATYYYCGEEKNLERDLGEMARSGIDIVLPLFKATKEIDAVVAAMEALEKEKKDSPRIAFFCDLRTDALAPRFFASVPPRFCALIDGRPVVWLSEAGPVKKWDKASFEAVAEMSRKTFAGRAPYCVAEVSWREAPADLFYSWGAQAGPRDFGVVSVGPGRDREEGKFYERSWAVAQRLQPRWVVVETWNGTDSGVCESERDGRKYLEATRNHVHAFKRNERIVLPKGKWSGASKVGYTLRLNPHEQGLRPVKAEDGLFDVVVTRGLEMLSTKENREGTRRCLYFDVDDSFCFGDRKSFEVNVEFLDTGEGAFSLEYVLGDRADPGRLHVSAGEVRFTGTSEWRTETFRLKDAFLGNLQEGGADFRLVVDKRGLAVRRIAVLAK